MLSISALGQKKFPIETISINGPQSLVVWLSSNAEELRAQYPSTISLEELQSIADQLTLKLQNKGFKLHRINIPAQKIENKTISFDVLVATLSDVSLYNVSMVDRRWLDRTIGKYKLAPIYQPDIDYALAKINATKGLSTFSYYSRGNVSLSSRINIKMIEQDEFDGVLQLDNKGSDSTGLYNANAALSINSLTGNADPFQISFGSSELLNWQASVDYWRPIFALNNRLNTNLSFQTATLAGEFETLSLTTHVLGWNLLDSFQGRKFRTNLGISGYHSRFESPVVDEYFTDKNDVKLTFGLSNLGLLKKGNHQLHWFADLSPDFLKQTLSWQWGFSMFEKLLSTTSLHNQSVLGKLPNHEYLNAEQILNSLKPSQLSFQNASWLNQKIQFRQNIFFSQWTTTLEASAVQIDDIDELIYQSSFGVETKINQFSLYYSMPLSFSNTEILNLNQRPMMLSAKWEF